MQPGFEELEKEQIVQLTVSSRHMDLSPALREHAEQKAGKLSKYYDRIQEIEVVFDNAKDSVAAEIIIHADHKNMFVAHHSVVDAYVCLYACVEKLERQLTDHK